MKTFNVYANGIDSRFNQLTESIEADLYVIENNVILFKTNGFVTHILSVHNFLYIEVQE